MGNSFLNGSLKISLLNKTWLVQLLASRPVERSHLPPRFAAFFTRAYDFIRMAAISQSNIKLMGSHVGVSIGEDGPSQMGLEDLAMMAAQPGMVVLYPSDGVCAYRLVEPMANHKGMVYMRTGASQKLQSFMMPMRLSRLEDQKFYAKVNQINLRLCPLA